MFLEPDLKTFGLAFVILFFLVAGFFVFLVMPLPSGTACSASPTFLSAVSDLIGLSSVSVSEAVSEGVSLVKAEPPAPPCHPTIDFTQGYSLLLQNDFLKVLTMIYFLLSPFVSYIVASWIVEKVWTESLQEEEK